VERLLLASVYLFMFEAWNPRYHIPPSWKLEVNFLSFTLINIEAGFDDCNTIMNPSVIDYDSLGFMCTV